MLKHKTAMWIVISFLLCLGVCWLMYAKLGDLLTTGLCGNEVYAQMSSPDGWRKAVVFERGCGATTGSSTQISVLPFYNSLSDADGGNVFVCDRDGGPSSVMIRWTDSLHLEVLYPATARTFHRETSVGGVTIAYVTFP